MFLWIDPPGAEPGWVHEITDPDSDKIEAVKAGYDIPDDNQARQEAYDAARSGPNEASPEAYQAGRDFWGVTALSSIPNDLPDGIIMIRETREQ